MSRDLKDQKWDRRTELSLELNLLGYTIKAVEKKLRKRHWDHHASLFLENTKKDAKRFSRHANLLIGYLRGREYADLEEYARIAPNWDMLKSLQESYGDGSLLQVHAIVGLKNTAEADNMVEDIADENFYRGGFEDWLKRAQEHFAFSHNEPRQRKGCSGKESWTEEAREQARQSGAEVRKYRALLRGETVAHDVTVPAAILSKRASR